MTALSLVLILGGGILTYAGFTDVDPRCLMGKIFNPSQSCPKLSTTASPNTAPSSSRGPCTPVSKNQLVARGNIQLIPEAMAGYECAVQKYGGDIPVTDSWRSPEQQAAGFAAKPGLVAPVGKSCHQAGRAIDVNMSYRNSGMDKALRACGWHQFDPVKEPWHYSYGVTG